MSKLRRERGASVVFALVIFLIVTIFSWTMVNGALTAAQNASMQREEEQAYLNVTSAARLFCKEAAFTLNDTVENIPYASFPDDWRDIFRRWGDGYYEDLGASRSLTSTPGSLIQKTFADMQDEVDGDASGNEKVTATRTLYIYAQETPDDNFEGFGTVIVTLTMTKTTVQNNVSYGAKAVFQNKLNNNAQKVLQSSVSVTFKGTETPPSQPYETTGTPPDATFKIEREMSWAVSSVERGRASS